MPAFCLYQPDIPQNVGGFIRLGACLGMPLHVVDPCGFPFDDKRLKRVAMDYGADAPPERHLSWEAFKQAWPGRRVFITNQQPTHTLDDFTFQPEDALVLGRESAGFPPEVLAEAFARIIIPMAPGARSLNVVTAGAMAAGEALRQLRNSSKRST